MYDFVKTKLLGINPKRLLLNSHLEFIQKVNTSTGELDNKQTAITNNMVFKIVNGCYTNLNGSLHKYKNQGLHNYNDFTISDLIEVLKDLSIKFDLNPYQTDIQNLEFGVNVELPYKVKGFLKSIVTYKGKEYNKETFNNRGYLLRFEFDHYDLKIYDKSLQYKLDKNIVRFEIKVKKMEYFNSKSRSIGIYTYVDLFKNDVIIKLKKLLIDAFNDLVFYDFSIKINTITKKLDKELLSIGQNPKYWSEFKTPHTKQYYRDLKRYRALVLKYGNGNIQNHVLELITEKLDCVFKRNEKVETEIAEYLSSFQQNSVLVLTAS
ncbi:MAG: hypothetical protein V4677_11115 [Bacteroidota bacterium]